MQATFDNVTRPVLFALAKRAQDSGAVFQWGASSADKILTATVVRDDIRVTFLWNPDTNELLASAEGLTWPARLKMQTFKGLAIKRFEEAIEAARRSAETKQGGAAA